MQHADKKRRFIEKKAFNGLMLGPSSSRISDIRGSSVVMKPKPVKSIMRDLYALEMETIRLSEALKSRFKVVLAVAGAVIPYMGGRGKKNAEPSWRKVVGAGDSKSVASTLTAAATTLREASPVVVVGGGTRHLKTRAEVADDVAKEKAARARVKVPTAVEILKSVMAGFDAVEDDSGEEDGGSGSGGNEDGGQYSVPL